MTLTGEVDLNTSELRLVLLGGGWAFYVVNLLDLTSRYPNIVVDG